MYYLQRNFIVWASLVLASAMSFSTMTQATDIYFSEYSEPNNSAAGVHFNDRYVEIYNGSASQIDMEDYAFVSCVGNCNGTNYKVVTQFTNNTNFPNTVVASGGVFTVRHSQDANIQAAIKTAADGKTSNLNYNGDDVFALVKKGADFTLPNAKKLIGVTVMDVLGAPSNPATFDDVCGEAKGLENVTLIKKPGKQGNTDWDNSRGTNATDCDWIVKAANDLTDIGQHSPAPEIYFSEYSEPNNSAAGVHFNDRYVEIYNGSASQIDMEDYAFVSCVGNCNGTNYKVVTQFTNNTNFPNTVVASGGVFTVRHSQDANIQAAIKTAADGKTSNLNYNGDDVFALVKKGADFTLPNAKKLIGVTVMDVLGAPSNPATFDDVCGEAKGLENVTLIKKPGKQGNTDWDNSRGTNSTDCDWVVKEANDLTDIGQHSPTLASDTTAPVITLTGNQIVEVALNGSYSDAGATASDDTDGTITASITTAGSTIDTSVPGTYAVTYNVSDAANNAAVQVVRTVIVDPWNFNGSKQGWGGANGVSVAAASTYAKLTFVGPGKNFPNFDSSATANINTAAGRYVAVTLKNNSLNTKYAMAVMVSGSPKWATTLTSQTTLDSDFKTVYFDMQTAGAANWTGTRQKLRFRATKVDGSSGVAAGTIFIDKIVVVPVKDTTAPTLSAVSIASSNASSTVAGVGDVVTLTMTANESIKTPAVTFKSGGAAVSDSSVTYTNTSGDTWTAAYTVESGDTAGSVSYSIAFNDTRGNSGTAVTSGSGSVSMDASPTITKSIVSAVNDGVTALGSVSANETVTWSISGSGVSISSAGVVTLDSAANYQVATSHSFTINATDSIGNVTSTGALSVSVVDATAPTITSGVVSSVNDGDTALGSMSSNEAVTWSITGSGVSISSSGAVTLDSAANAGSATSHSFTVTATDGSGNATTTGTLSVLVVDTTAPVISLVGNAVVSLELGTAYSDAGATATDNKDGTVTSSITTVSDVDVNTVGTYTVTYNVADVAGNTATQVTRTINIGGDTTIPVISLVGSASVNVERANAYSDLGATATDNFDGTITSSIVTVNGVDVTTSGTYTVTYDVNDAAGNAATQVTRIVTVADTTPPGLTVANLNLNVADGATALGSVSANETVTWSVTGSGVSISSSGSVTLDSPADYLVRTSYSFEITATDAYGNFRRIPVIVVVDDITAPLFDYSGLVTSINDGGTALGSVSANEPVTWSISGSGVSISSEGTITLDSPANYVEAQSHQYRVTATDKQGGAGRIGYDFIVEVIDITAPTFDYSGLLGTIYEGTTALGSMSANEPVNWTISGSGVSISSSGVVTLDSPASYEVARFHKYRVSATDKQGGAGRTGYFWTAAVEPNTITLVIPDDRVVNAVGYLTGVNLDPEGIAVAADGAGNAIDIVADQTGPFQSGNHEIEWSATSAGLTVIATQSLKIHPLVNLATAIRTTEGDSLDIEVLLSGQAADYPVTVPFTVSGTAVEGEDYSVGSTGSVTITEGTMASVSLSITADAVAESEESVVITLGEATNAALGVSSEQVITIVEENLPPQVILQVSQAEVDGSTISQKAGIVIIKPEIVDINAADTHTVDWTNALLTLPDATVVVVDGEGSEFPYEVLEIDPSDLSGVYLVAVDVNDSVDSVSVAVNMNVLAQAPELSEKSDSDGDGISDAEEGAGDSDGDGIPDYADNIVESNLIPAGDGGATVESEPGTTLILGSVALGAGDNNVSITEEEIAALTDVGDTSYDYPEALIDFAATGAEFGHSYTLVVPLSVGLPEGAVYRKYSTLGGWANFVENGANGLSSTMSVEGVCPELGSDAYTLGLTVGDNCLALLVEDGGPNDADGVANGTLVDPGGIAIKYIGTPSDSSEITLSSAQLTANGSATATVTITVLDTKGVGLEHMSVSASVDISGAGVGTFVEQGSGVYKATLTAGNTVGSAAVVAVINNGEVSVTVSSDPITLNAVAVVTPSSNGVGGGGCTVATDGSADASLLLLLMMAGLLLARRRYQLR